MRKGYTKRRTCLWAALLMSYFAVLPSCRSPMAAETAPGVWKKLPGDAERLRFFKPLLIPGNKLLFWSTEFDLSTGASKKLVPGIKDKIIPYRYHKHFLKLKPLDGKLQPSRYEYFNQAVYVPSLNKAFYFAGGVFLSFDLKTKQWAEVKTAKRPPLVVFSAMEYDPVNDEIVLFGGGARSGEHRPGTWLYSFKKKDWRRPELGCAQTNSARKLFEEFRERARRLRIKAMHPIRNADPKHLAADIARETRALRAAVGKAAEGMKKDAGKLKDRGFAEQLGRAGSLAREASGALDRAVGSLAPASLWKAGNGIWAAERKLRRVVRALLAEPPARCLAPMAYDSKNKLIALFGGNDQTRYLTDTWVYDCSKRQWRELETNVQPWPRRRPCFTYLEKHGVFLMGGAPATIYEKIHTGNSSIKQPHLRKLRKINSETWTLDAAKGKWTLVGGVFPASETWASMTYDKEKDRAVLYQVPRDRKLKGAVYIWHVNTTPSKEKAILAPEKPLYIYHPPQWYTEGLPPADTTAGAKFIEALVPNKWTEVKTPRPAHTRTWGSATFDTDRGEVVYWGGGHCGYTGTDVSHFSLRTLRWSISSAGEFPPEQAPFYGPGVNGGQLPVLSLRGRPWVPHADTTYAYDAASKKVFMTGQLGNGGYTHIYDPSKRDFVGRFPQPFEYGGASFPTLLCPTPHGMICYQAINSYWKGMQKGLFKLDTATRKWTKIGLVSKQCRSASGNRMVYDSKRDRLVFIDYKTRALSEWRFKDKPSAWKVMKCIGEVPKSSLVRESVYIPRHDVILSCAGEWLCDLGNGNKWMRTGIDGLKGGRNTAMTYDPKLDVLIRFQGGSRGRVKLWLMRFEPRKTAEKKKEDAE